MLDGLKSLVIRIGIENIIDKKFIADALADIEFIEKKLFANELPTQKVPMRFEPTHIKCIRNESIEEITRRQIAKDAEMTENDLI